MEGGSRELADAVRDGSWKDLEGLSERERALLTVARKLSAEPTKMVESDWAPLRALGFTDDGLLEVAHIVGIFNHLTRLADGMGLELDSATAEAARTGKVLGS